MQLLRNLYVKMSSNCRSRCMNSWRTKPSMLKNSGNFLTLLLFENGYVSTHKTFKGRLQILRFQKGLTNLMEGL
jgi:hypothetical protein